MKKSKFYPALVLSSICLVVAVLLSVINYFTAPIIDQREKDKAAGALAVVLPGGSDFKSMSTDGLPEGVLEAHSAVGGYVFKVQGTGRNGAIVVMVGVDSDGKIAGTQLISNSESAGYKEPVFAQVDGPDTAYKGQDLANYEAIIVTGSTMTSKGYAEAINVALRAFAAVSGGDSRTPEQIFQDNCNAALGTEGLTYTKWFATEVVEGVDAVYESTAGKVYVIGESLVGVNTEGAVVTAEVSAEDSAKALAAHTIIAASTTEEITEIPAVDQSLKTSITKISKTASGNYVFELSATGYDLGFEYSDGHMPGNTPSPILIKLTISAEGKIIDVVTVSHKETAGKGDCDTEEYYEGWKGAESSDVTITPGVPTHNSTHTQNATDLGVLSGATYTTQGYQSAVKAAFNAFELLTNEGGND